MLDMCVQLHTNNKLEQHHKINSSAVFVLSYLG